MSYTETIESGGDACNVFSDRSLDISEMTGNEVYVSFRHHDVTCIYDIYVQQGLGLDNQRFIPQRNYYLYSLPKLLQMKMVNTQNLVFKNIAQGYTL